MTKLRAVELMYRKGKLTKKPKSDELGTIEMDGIRISVNNKVSKIIDGWDQITDADLPKKVYFFLVPTTYISDQSEPVNEFTAVNLSFKKRKCAIKKDDESKHDPCQTVSTIDPVENEDEHFTIYFGISDLGNLIGIKKYHAEDEPLEAWQKVICYPDTLEYIKNPLNPDMQIPCYLFHQDDPNWIWENE